MSARTFDGAQAGPGAIEASFAGTLQMGRDLGVDDTLPPASIDNFERAMAALFLGARLKPDLWFGRSPLFPAVNPDLALATSPAAELPGLQVAGAHHMSALNH